MQGGFPGGGGGGPMMGGPGPHGGAPGGSGGGGGGGGGSSSRMSYFFDYLKSSSLIEEADLNSIRGADPKNQQGSVLGIDGGHILKIMLNDLQVKGEPYFYLNNMLPQGTKKWLGDFVANLQNNGIKPIFVFDGMPVEAADWSAARGRTPPVSWNDVRGLQSNYDLPGVRQPGQQATQEDPSQRPDVAGALNRMQRDALDKHIDMCSLHSDEDIVSYVVRFLLSIGIEAFRAPYWAWPQLVAFMAKGNRYIGDIYGATELLAFENLDRLILEIDTAGKKIKYVQRQAIIDGIRQCPDLPQDIDLCTAILCDSQHKFFSYFTYAQTVRHANFNHLLQHVGKEGGMTYIASMPKLAQIQCAVKFPLVLNNSGEMVMLNKLWYPKDNVVPTFPLKDIYGTRLPNCFYFFQFCNAISPQTMVAVVSSKILDPQVLVETKEAKIAVERVLPLRTQIVFQLVQQLASNAAASGVEHNYFSSDFSLTWIRNSMPVPILRPPQIKLDEWTGIREDEDSNFTNVLDYAVNAARDAHYANVKQAIAAVHLKSLDLLGYFTHATHSNAHEVSGKSVYSEALSYCQQEPDHAVLLIELLRTRSLTDAPYTTISDSVSVQLSEGVRFFCRLVSLVPVQLKGPYHGPTHTGLLAFNTIVRHLHRTLRSLAEVVGLTLFLENRTTFSIKDFSQFPNELPFREPPGIIAGVVAFFIMCGPPDSELNSQWDSIETHSRRYEYLQTVFTDAVDIKKVISDIFHFWDVGVNMLIQLHADETPTVEAEVTQKAVEFHNSYVVGTAAKYDIKLDAKTPPAQAPMTYNQY